MKVAAIQMVSGVERDENLVRARMLIEAAAMQGAELVVLPEHFCLLGRQDSDKLEIREALGRGPIQEFLARSARDLGLWLVGGTLPLLGGSERDAAKPCNSTLVYSPEGKCVAQYDKIHLFRFDNGRESFDEARTLQSGHLPVTFELPSRDGHRWCVGLSVCYDLRFPELFRVYARSGADLLLVPSAFTHTTGSAHWEVLLRARAIENLAFVAAPAQGGVHENGRQTWGHTMLIDPWGNILGMQPTGESVVVAEFDASRISRCREQLPALEHRVL